jgi:hypothetical protein
MYQSNRPLHELVHDVQLGIEREGPFVELCNTHLLQLNLSGGPIYNNANAVTAPAEAGRDQQQEQQQRESSHCYQGRDGVARLRDSWRRLVECSNGRECATSVSFKFFGRDKLFVPKALVVEDGRRLQQQQPHVSQTSDQQEALGALVQRGQQAEPMPQGEPPLLAAYFEFDRLFGPQGLRPPGGLDPAPGGSRDGSAPLSAMDCLALAESGCTAVFIEGVPFLHPEQRDCAMRFVTLLDVLWDHQTQREC